MQATCNKSAVQVALKVGHMDQLTELARYQARREVRVHTKLQHENIIHLLAAFEVGVPLGQQSRNCLGLLQSLGMLGMAMILGADW